MIHQVPCWFLACLLSWPSKRSLHNIDLLHCAMHCLLPLLAVMIHSLKFCDLTLWVCCKLPQFEPGSCWLHFGLHIELVGWLQILGSRDQVVLMNGREKLIHEWWVWLLVLLQMVIDGRIKKERAWQYSKNDSCESQENYYRGLFVWIWNPQEM